MNRKIHKCNSHKEGSEVVYTCNLCPDYEARFNPFTGDINRKGVRQDVSHSGTYVNQSVSNSDN